MGRGMRGGLLNDKGNGSVKISIDGGGVGCVGGGESLGVNYGSEIGLIG